VVCVCVVCVLCVCVCVCVWCVYVCVCVYVHTYAFLSFTGKFGFHRQRSDPPPPQKIITQAALNVLYCNIMGGRDSSVGIATRYGLDGPGNESRWEARFSGPGDHPASCTVGTGSLLGVKRSGRGADHPPHLAPRLKEE
jgi:hypothetical protein